MPKLYKLLRELSLSARQKAPGLSQNRGQNVQPCTRDDPQEALQDACHALDLPKPLWLPKNQREWEEFGQTRFLPDAFMEHVDFDRLEIEYIDPDAK